ncbi:MAG: hypothetical protein H6R19_881 [Proteobacteria bacterium]|nr:hypothetical protein [Pseudomonadota bacterium]
MEWLLLLAGAFLAGLIDAVVGGGGLVQLPLLLAVFPSVGIPILFGTNKISSIAGTASSAWQYSRKVSISYRLALPASLAALIGAASGAAVVSFLPNHALKPMVLVLLVVVGVYTWFKPEFGRRVVQRREWTWPRLLAVLLGFGLGFYDGFFGPGTGSFLIFGFVRLFGMDMLHASASAKLVNFATNLAALVFFLSHDGVLWQVGLAMACANIAGAQVGTWMAVRHGNAFIRWLLLTVVSVLAIKLAWDIFSH